MSFMSNCSATQNMLQTCIIIITMCVCVVISHQGGIVDYEQYCCPWAKRGECRINPQFMLVHCTIACHTFQCISSPKYYPVSTAFAQDGLRTEQSPGSINYDYLRSHAANINNPINSKLWSRTPVLQPLVPVHAISYPIRPMKPAKVQYRPTPRPPPVATTPYFKYKPETKPTSLKRRTQHYTNKNGSVNISNWSYVPRVNPRTTRPQLPESHSLSKLPQNDRFSRLQKSRMDRFSEGFDRLNSLRSRVTGGRSKDVKVRQLSPTAQAAQYSLTKNNRFVPVQKEPKTPQGKYEIVAHKHRPNVFSISSLIHENSVVMKNNIGSATNVPKKTTATTTAQEQKYAIVDDNSRPNTFSLSSLVDKKKTPDRKDSFSIVLDSSRKNTFVISDLIEKGTDKTNRKSMNVFGRNPPVIQPTSRSVISPQSSVSVTKLEPSNALGHDYYCLFNLIKSGKLETIPMILHQSNGDTQAQPFPPKDDDRGNFGSVNKAPKSAVTNMLKLVGYDIPPPFNNYAIVNPFTQIREVEHGYNPFANPVAVLHAT